MTVRCIRFLTCLFLALAMTAMSVDAATNLTNVRVEPASFNPSLDEKVTIVYALGEPDKVTVRVYDPDNGLIRTLVDGEPREAGSHSETWDGKDWQGRVVPDEAYFFTVETASGEVYDPTTYSGGVVGDLTDARFDRESGTVNYRLPAASRVLIRLGVQSGPMLKTLVDWKPRVVGEVTEYWDGRDEDDLVGLWERPDFSALITYVTLPEATTIAFGNKEESYRDLKLGRGQGRPAKPERPPSSKRAERLRPEGLVPPAWARAPEIAVSFPKVDSGEPSSSLPEVAGPVAVRVDVDDSDRQLLAQEQFEILFFVDHVFFAEAERGYLPYNWRWEVANLPPGEHLLTVNVSSFNGQVGVSSRKVRVSGGASER